MRELWGNLRSEIRMDKMDRDLAIHVSGAVKRYGTHTVLKKLDMEVPYGCM